MGQDLPVTAHALLGLLTFGDEQTGYELKQRADRTLRFYWVSPAMSQIYTELGRLAQRGLVEAVTTGDRGTRYRITDTGRTCLSAWLTETPAGFPVLKHPVALRLLLGHLVDPEVTIAMVREHIAALDAERAALQEVRTSLHGRDEIGDTFGHPALVADWGLDYFAHERTIMEDLLRRLEEARTQGARPQEA